MVLVYFRRARHTLILMYWRPPEYEFTYKTRVEALKRAKFTCEECGVRQEDGYALFVHHVLGIAFARYYYPSIAPVVISSLANARVLCSDCHLEADNAMREDHAYLAARLVGMLVE